MARLIVAKGFDPAGDKNHTVSFRIAEYTPRGPRRRRVEATNRVAREWGIGLRGRVVVVVGGGQTPGETIGNGRAAAIVYAREGAGSSSSTGC